MAPAQHSAEIDADIKPNFAIKIESDQKAKDQIGKNHVNGISDGQIVVPKDTEDMAIDVTESKRSNDIKVSAKVDLDETECSSSFGDTSSGNENFSGGLSDTEVESQFHGDGDGSLTSAFNGFSSMFPMRKKKLTAHWRNFISPLMWRCKWAELKAKQFQLLAAKYDRELAAFDQIKQTKLDKITLEESGSRSLPFASQDQRKKLVKRRKRKRVEETTDATLYMSSHNLFSYGESMKSDLDGTSMGDDFVNTVSKEQNTTGGDDGLDNDWSFLEEDDTIEEKTLQKIESVHARVHKMKAQLDLIMTKYSCKFSSYENLSRLMTVDGQTSSVPSPTFSACNGETASMGGLCSPLDIPDYDFVDFIMPDSAVSSYGGEDIFIPDIIESTVGLLSSADVTNDQAQVADSCEEIMDNVLISNGVVKMVGKTLRKNDNESVENHQDSDSSGDEESVDTTLQAASESEAVTNTFKSQGESTLKPCLASDINFPRNKRKRGERKAGSGGWSRQRQGEPDSH